MYLFCWLRIHFDKHRGMCKSQWNMRSLSGRFLLHGGCSTARGMPESKLFLWSWIIKRYIQLQSVCSWSLLGNTPHNYWIHKFIVCGAMYMQSW